MNFATNSLRGNRMGRTHMKNPSKSFVALSLVLCVMCMATMDAAAIICSYDTLNRLTRVDYDNGTSIAYTYDAAGNRLTFAAQTGVASDRVAPVIHITQPTAGHLYVTTAGSVTLAGTASDANGVSSLSCTNDIGAQAPVDGSTSWTAGPIALSNGLNRVIIAALDPTGNVGRATLVVVKLAADAGSDPYSFDADGDGVPDWAEILSRTSTTNANSHLRFWNPTAQELAPGHFLLEWASSTGVLYSVERSTNLVASDAGFVLLKSGIPGLDGSTTYLDTNAPPQGSFFYRIGVDY